MYSDFVFLDRFLFELSCKNTHTHTRTHTHTHTDSNEYPIVAFSKNATIIRMKVFSMRVFKIGLNLVEIETNTSTLLGSVYLVVLGTHFYIGRL